MNLLPDDPYHDQLAKHAAGVQRLATHLVFDAQRAEDVAQETMRIAIAKPPARGGSLGAWLSGIARNVASKSLRSERRRRAHEHATPPRGDVPSTAELVQRMEERRRVVDAVLALDEPYRTAVILRYFEDVSAADIATQLGIPVETVRTRLKRALERLRLAMDAKHGGSRNAWSIALLPFVTGPRLPVPVAPDIPTLVGGLAVKKSIAIAAGLCLLAGGTTWVVREVSRPDAPPAGGAGAIDVADADAATLAGSKPTRPGVLDPSVVSAPPPIDLTAADRELDLHGIVVDRTGAPVAGARLQVVRYPWRRAALNARAVYDAVEDGPDSISSTDGSFRIRLRRGAQVSLRARAAGFAPVERRGCSAGRRLKLVMAPGVLCVVTFRDEGGAPVPDTPVRLFRLADGEWELDRREITGADGQAVFADLPGSLSVFVEEEPTRVGSIGWQRVELPATGRIAAEFVLPTGRELHGRVTDADTGAPVAGARVGINWTLHRATTTGANGEYEILGWNARQGASTLHVVAEGFGRSATKIEPGQAAIDFALMRGDGAVGRAVDAEGRPLAGVRVASVGIGTFAGSDAGDPGRTTTTTADGRFALTSLKRTLEHALVFMAEGRGRYLLDVAPHSGGPGTIDVGDVALPEARMLGGRVLDAANRPVADAPVSLRGANEDRRRFVGADTDREQPFYGQSEQAYTDDLGRYRFPDLSPGTYSIQARVPGRVSSPRSVILRRDADMLDADLKLADGHDVVVRVQGERGESIPRAWLNANDELGHRVSGESDERGECHFSLTDARWTVLATAGESRVKGARRYLLASAAVPAGATELVLVLRDAAAISGRVEDQSGRALGSMNIVGSIDGRDQLFARTDSSGSFSLDVPAKGTATLRVTGRDAKSVDGQPALTRFTCKPVQVRPDSGSVVIVAESDPLDRTMSVTVLTPDGKPAAGARVYLWGDDGESHDAAADADGKALFTNAPRGVLKVTASPNPKTPTNWVAPHLEVADSAAGEVTVTFREGVLLSGTVYGSDGRPMKEGMIEAYARNAELPFNATGIRSGSFQLRVDPSTPLPIRLQATSTGEASGQFGSTEVNRLPADGVEIRSTSR